MNRALALRVTLKEAIAKPAVLLDTNVLIDAFKSASNRMEEIPRSRRATTVVVKWEFLHGGRTKGLMLSEKEREDRSRFLRNSGVKVHGFHAHAQTHFHQLLDRPETCPDGLADGLIAAEALARKLPLLTRDVGDFERVPGLELVRDESPHPPV